MKKKVLIIGPSPTRSKGGMATVIQEMLESKILNNDFDLEMHESYRDGNIFYRLIFSIYSFVKFLFIYKKYDIFHLHVASNGSTFRKMIYAKLIEKANKRIILHIHGGQYLEFYKSLSKNNQVKVKKFLIKADYVIALSEKWKSCFEKNFKLKNCIVLQNGIDIDKYEEAKKYPKELNKKILFLGRIVEEKGIFDLMEALSIAIKKYNDICIYVGGDGDKRKVLELIKKYRLENNFKLVGWLNEEKKIKMLSKVDTFILPSYYEALPMSILEAMACGKAIISTKVGAIPEVISEENGILVDVGDTLNLAKAIIKCCEEEVWMREVYSTNIEKIFNLYNLKYLHLRLNKCYCNLIDKIINI